MYSRFLRAKHWHIFSLVVLLPYGLQFIITRIPSEIGDSSFIPEILIGLFDLLILISIFSYFAWQWSIVQGLSRLIPKDLKLKKGLFKIFFWTPLLYFTFMLVVMSTQAPFIISNWSIITIALITPVHLASIIGIFHTWYFVAKIIRTLELGRKTTISDLRGEILKVLFYPIGVWWIQPKVNRLMGGETTTNKGYKADRFSG